MPGHLPYGIHRFVSGEGQPRYYTMLRDPVERAISFYYECLWPRGDKKVADHPEHATAWKHDLIDFYQIPRFRNVQTRMIAGTWANYFGQYVAFDRIGLGKMVLSIAKTHLKKSIGPLELRNASRSPDDGLPIRWVRKLHPQKKDTRQIQIVQQPVTCRNLSVIS